MFCQNFQAHAIDLKAKKLFRLRCKQWDCPQCAKINNWIWRKHLRAYVSAVGYDNWSLITITARGKAHKNASTLEAIIKNWDRLLKRLRYVWGKFPYVRVYEKHKSGEFHAHMLVRYMPPDSSDERKYRTYGKKNQHGEIVKLRRYRGIAHTQLKRSAFGVGLGFICDFSPILMNNTEDDNHRVNRIVSYITKYLTKGFSDGLPKHTRRIQTSREIGSPKGDKSGSVLDLVYYLGITDIALHGEIEDVSRGHFVSFDDFWESDTYPPDTIEY